MMARLPLKTMGKTDTLRRCHNLIHNFNIADQSINLSIPFQPSVLPHSLIGQTTGKTHLPQSRA
jgi:hypothetical protein